MDRAIHEIGLVKYDAARAALAEAHRIDEVMEIMDKAEAVRVYAKQIGDVDLQNMAAEIRSRAVIRAGELLIEMKQNGQRRALGVRGKKKDVSTDDIFLEAKSLPPSLDTLGIDRRRASKWSAVAEQKEKAEELIESAKKTGQEITVTGLYKTVTRKKREANKAKRRRENAKTVKKATTLAELTGKFSTIVIDPPWDKGDEGDVDQLGRAQPTYKTMPLEELQALPVGKLADKDCHLYLWITNRSLPKGFALLESWGFRYITCLTWIKPTFGMGNYFRGSTEHVLFGVKGHQMLKRQDVGTWFSAKRGKDGHSSKPDKLYDLVESVSYSPYIDLFSRSQRDGWKTWGAETPAYSFRLRVSGEAAIRDPEIRAGRPTVPIPHRAVELLSVTRVGWPSGAWSRPAKPQHPIDQVAERSSTTSETAGQERG